jgi:hypothetical protein
MKKTLAVMACVLAGLACVPRVSAMQAAAGQSFLSDASTVDVLPGPAAGDAPDAQQYADGKKAIHESRWGDAIKIFDRVAAGGGDHAAGAMYWKAYAQNKTGQPDAAISTCGELRTQFVANSWSEDCGALEIEIRSSKGQPVPLKPGESDELKLLALSTLMQKDPARARTQIQEILESDSSERLKEGAIFILGVLTPEAVYPEIVRISYLEGDVRVARASENENAKNAKWEAAEMNLPLSPGDTVVTGAGGRAEIEFEDASTVYLGENSVLNCQDMHTLSQIPHTEIALVSGTLTTHLDSLMAGETFLLKTPTNDLLTRYPQKADMRVTSYVDGMAVASLRSGTLGLPGSGKQELAPGQALFFNAEHHVMPLSPSKTENYASWDAWVADRYAARSAATAEVMQQAGLTAPTPGLADMKGQGTFFDCPPYGRCWEPAGGQSHAQLVAGTAPQPTPKSASPSSGAGGAGGTSAYPQEFFPCLPSAMLNSWYARGAWSMQQRNGASRMNAGYDPYAWSVCHVGGWIHHNGRYVWVAGPKRHHHPPVAWVKDGKTVAFVPIHPKDVKGNAPLNAEHGFAPLHDKDGYTLTPVKFDPVHPVEMMKSPPREFRSEPAPVLAKADAPRLEAHSANDVNKTGLQKTTAIPLSFDHRSQGFSTSHAVMQGGHSVMVSSALGHVSGGSSGSGGSGGGFHGGSSTASSGGGGSHGGGGGTASSSISVSSSSSSSASSGGSHK